jgi:hypothetical protein
VLKSTHSLHHTQCSIHSASVSSFSALVYPVHHLQSLPIPSLLLSSPPSVPLVRLPLFCSNQFPPLRPGPSYVFVLLHHRSHRSSSSSRNGFTNGYFMTKGVLDADADPSRSVVTVRPRVRDAVRHHIPRSHSQPPHSVQRAARQRHVPRIHPRTSRAAQPPDPAGRSTRPKVRPGNLLCASNAFPSHSVCTQCPTVIPRPASAAADPQQFSRVNPSR